MNSEPMVDALCSYLGAIGVDIDEERSRGSLIFVSEPTHLAPDGAFDVERMMRLVKQLLEEALRDGFDGLFGSGDMAWELGPKKDLSKLLEYEWWLEQFLREHPQLKTICQYHLDTLPREALRTGSITHEMILVDETLSVPNPNFIRVERAVAMLDL